MRGRKWLVAVVMAGSFGTAGQLDTPPAWAGTPSGAAAPSAADRQQAKTHANAGYQAFQAKEYARAIEEFGAAEKLVHAPPHVLFMARSFAALGRLVEAREQYRVVLGEALDAKAPSAFRKAQSDAATELAELEKRIPRVALTVEAPAGVQPELTLDGAPLEGPPDDALWVDPGSHVLRAEAAGHQSAEATVELREAEGTVEVKLTLTPLGPAGPPDEGSGSGEPIDDEPFDLPIGPTVLTVAGIAVLAAGGITGGLALDRASELRDTCPQNPCPTEHESLADEANLLATISTVSFIAGGLATAGGIAWFVVAAVGLDEPTGGADDADAAALRVRPVVGVGSLGVAGAWR